MRYFDLEESSDKTDDEAMIFIHALNPYKSYGGGRYAMDALKRVSPTENFLNLPKSIKGCTNDDKQECKKKQYIDQKIKDCNCIPWEFSLEVRNIVKGKVDPRVEYFCLNNCLNKYSKHQTKCHHSVKKLLSRSFMISSQSNQ